MGNILATITDAKIYQTNGSPAKVISGTDYYAFGAAMPSRSYQDAAYSKYRYGFNNMEKDEETGTHHFKYREDDQDAGRFWSVDPLAAQYPWNSPYAFAENDVIRSIDLEGTEKLSFHLMSNYRANQLKIFTMRDIAPRQVLSEVMRYSAIEFRNAPNQQGAEDWAWGQYRTPKTIKKGVVVSGTITEGTEGSFEVWGWTGMGNSKRFERIYNYEASLSLPQPKIENNSVFGGYIGFNVEGALFSTVLQGKAGFSAELSAYGNFKGDGLNLLLKVNVLEGGGSMGYGDYSFDSFLKKYKAVTIGAKAGVLYNHSGSMLDAKTESWESFDNYTLKSTFVAPTPMLGGKLNVNGEVDYMDLGTFKVGFGITNAIRPWGVNTTEAGRERGKQIRLLKGGKQ